MSTLSSRTRKAGICASSSGISVCSTGITISTSALTADRNSSITSTTASARGIGKRPTRRWSR